jgi:CrcB protein
VLTRILAVAAGGALGAVTRYLASGWVARSAQSVFPFGTLAVNVTGALVLGAIMGSAASGRFLLSPTTRTFLTIGILGGYTTFSTFSYETIEALRVGDLRVAFGNLAATLLLGLSACWIGLKLGERL